MRKKRGTDSHTDKRAQGADWRCALCACSRGQDTTRKRLQSVWRLRIARPKGKGEDGIVTRPPQVLLRGTQRMVNFGHGHLEFGSSRIVYCLHRTLKTPLISFVARTVMPAHHPCRARP
eukprot:3662804-Rhodomonas_salina.11